jgi:hypothetical protein
VRKKESDGEAERPIALAGNSGKERKLAARCWLLTTVHHFREGSTEDE